MNIISTFNDSLYGEISFPQLIAKCLASPEIIRLKDIRLSNINCDQTPGLSNTSRFEHIIGCTYLAYIFAKNNNFSERDIYELCVAAMYHDVATPPFGHSFELVLSGFNHEIETRNIIMGSGSNLWKSPYENQYFQGSYPKLPEIISSYNRNVKERLSLERIAEYTIGKGKFGSLIKNDIDLDNLDNIIRAAFYSGIKVDKDLPVRIVNRSKLDERGNLVLAAHDKELIDLWKQAKYLLYDMFLNNKHDLVKELYLQYIFKIALDLNVLTQEDWGLSDRQIITKLVQHSETAELYKKLETNRLPIILMEGWCFEKDYLAWSKKNTKNIEKAMFDLKKVFSQKKQDSNFICAIKKDRRYTKLKNVIFEDKPYLFGKATALGKLGSPERKYFIYIFIDGDMPSKLDRNKNPIMISGQPVKMNKKEVVDKIIDYFTDSGLKINLTYKLSEKGEPLIYEKTLPN
ncbi:MAG: HD domain-containing protein [Patescibacteria group bacterium]